jgi:hypothetical protein
MFEGIAEEGKRICESVSRAAFLSRKSIIRGSIEKQSWSEYNDEIFKLTSTNELNSNLIKRDQFERRRNV